MPPYPLLAAALREGRVRLGSGRPDSRKRRVRSGETDEDAVKLGEFLASRERGEIELRNRTASGGTVKAARNDEGVRRDEIIPENEWRWRGMPGHFGAAECCFHMVTEISGYRVSTIGCYHKPGDPKDDNHRTMIGSGRFYETFVFAIDTDDQIIPSELDTEGYMEEAEAEQGHLRMCRKWANPVTRGGTEVLRHGTKYEGIAPDSSKEMAELLNLILNDMPTATASDLAADRPMDEEGRVWDQIVEKAHAIAGRWITEKAREAREVMRPYGEDL